MARTAVIHGTGLIGASIGLALRHAGWDVIGWDPDPAALATASRRGALTEVTDDPTRHSADLVVVAAPPSQIMARLESLRTDALVTDVAGVKGPVVTTAAHLPHFVGGHPMAGGATSGPDLASSRLFHGAGWVLTTDGVSEADLLFMEDVVRSCGANPIRMTAAEHDAAVALISHLPHLTAAALMNLGLAEPHALALAGGGFRDLTRVAGSETDWWTEVLVANATEILRAIGGLEAGLGGYRRALENGDRDHLRELLEVAREGRRGLGEHHTQVRVVLLDRPGEIARVGHALEATRADVRDFQLRHGEHGGGGILTISVSPDTAQALGQALRDEGFEIES
jgi:prephenate dehydrogenase